MIVDHNTVQALMATIIIIILSIADINVDSLLFSSQILRYIDVYSNE